MINFWKVDNCSAVGGTCTIEGAGARATRDRWSSLLTDVVDGGAEPQYAAAEGELSDADLERVAGGKQDITANCLVLGGTAVSNTVMQLNL